MALQCYFSEDFADHLQTNQLLSRYIPVLCSQRVFGSRDISYLHIQGRSFVASINSHELHHTARIEMFFTQ